MTTPAEFRTRAAECDVIALKQTNSGERETWTFIASHWRSMADEVEVRRTPRQATAAGTRT
jgi:hypothetical protein